MIKSGSFGFEQPFPCQRLFRAEQARAADAFTIETLKVPGIVLMDHAGRAVAREARRLAAGRPVVVVCGPGNNGGDGWVCARHLIAERSERNAPSSVTVVSTAEPEALKGDAKTAAEMFLKTAGALGLGDRGPPVALAIDRAAALEMHIEQIGPGLVVDALFGTGLTRPLEGMYAELVEILDRRKEPLLAVDLPSGLPSDGAAPSGPALSATCTITFGGLKVAHVTEPCALHCGELVCADIGILPDPSQSPVAGLVGERLVGHEGRLVLEEEPLHLPVDDGSDEAGMGARSSRKSRSVHKGRFGHVGVLEGARSTAGASRLAARAALRAGAGLCTLLVDEHRDGLPVEIMQRHLTPGGVPPLDGFSAVVVGPGLGRGEEGAARARAVLIEAGRRNIPAVVDAEALELLGESTNGLAAVATPHPGEAGRLLGSSSSSVQADRPQALAKLRELAEVTWLLKGAYPLISTAAGFLTIRGGTPTLAVGGSGDVLAGAIGALLARGMSPTAAAAMGALAHQRAGRAAGISTSPDGGAGRGVFASEIADALARVIAAGPVPTSS